MNLSKNAGEKVYNSWLPKDPTEYSDIWSNCEIELVEKIGKTVDLIIAIIKDTISIK